MLYDFNGKAPQIGSETYVSETALVIGDVRIGNNCYIGHSAILRGDHGSIEIGDGTAVEEGVIIHAPPYGTCQIGKRVTLGHGAIVHSLSIGDFATIGMGAIISVETHIGEESIVAEGSIVKVGQRVPSKVVVAGNPAKVVREISQRDEFGKVGKQAYIELAKEYLSQGMHKIN